MLESVTNLAERNSTIHHKEDLRAIVTVTDNSKNVMVIRGALYHSDKMKVSASIINEEMYVSLQDISWLYRYHYREVKSENLVSVNIDYQ